MPSKPPVLPFQTLTPFLYPCFRTRPTLLHRVQTRASSSIVPPVDYERLNPSPDDFAVSPFADRCTLQVHAGPGGHGCVSFLREKFIAEGPPNGGDGGTGGNIYIQAVRGETSLHKIAKRGILKAGRGRNGQGKSRGGERGEDILITVPVGTVVREISRFDPIEAENERLHQLKRSGMFDEQEEGINWRRDKWLLYPGTLPSSFSTSEIPKAPRGRRSPLAQAQPEAPIRLDLDKPMKAPMVLAAGGAGGLGNPNFITADQARPKFATKGEEAIRMTLQLELKILADVGLVGLPNAGKSTLLRSLTNSKARVGNWAFTTLQPNIGTVVLDNHKGRPLLRRFHANGEPRTHFTIADIPGLIEDAHLDRGLGHGFLRHIERAAVLAFVVDLSSGDAVENLKGLWNEVREFEQVRTNEVAAETQQTVEWTPYVDRFEDRPEETWRNPEALLGSGDVLPPLEMPPMTDKPWFVVATKADLDGSQENFEQLRQYLARVEDGTEEHPSGKKNAWKKRVRALPVCAMRAEGVEKIPEVVVDLLEEREA
jgi:GTPase